MKVYITEELIRELIEDLNDAAVDYGLALENPAAHNLGAAMAAFERANNKLFKAINLTFRNKKTPA